MTTARTSVSVPSARNVSSSSSHICALMAFFLAGRVSVTVTTPSRRSTRMVSRCGSDTSADDTDGVGLNPFRQQQRSYADYVIVAVAVLVCVLLVLWAAFG